MTDYFIWNGVDCRTKGIHVSELPPITIPLERSKQTNVPGRPGSLTQLEGDDVYDDMILTATCFIADPAQIPAIAAWLKGKGTVTFANRTGGHYNARIANQIPFEKVLRGNPHCTFAVNFRCYPFWYKDNVSDVTITTSGSTITNPGSVYSEPIITVTGSGDITLMVGTTIVELTDVSQSIVINSIMATNGEPGKPLSYTILVNPREYPECFIKGEAIQEIGKRLPMKPTGSQHAVAI